MLATMYIYKTPQFLEHMILKIDPQRRRDSVPMQKAKEKEKERQKERRGKGNEGGLMGSWHGFLTGLSKKCRF